MTGLELRLGASACPARGYLGALDGRMAVELEPPLIDRTENSNHVELARTSAAQLVELPDVKDRKEQGAPSVEWRVSG